MVGTITRGVAGVGLYIAQFMEKVVEDNIKRSFSLMLMMCFSIASLFAYLGVFHGEFLLGMFSKDVEAVSIGNSYLKRASLSYIPNMLSFSFAVAYRNIQKSKVPMVVCIIDMVTNGTLNYLLIFNIGTALYVVKFNRLGTDAYKGYRIAETVVSIMFGVGMGLSSATSAMIGQELGRSNYLKAKKYGDNFLSLELIIAIFLGIISFFLANPLVFSFPKYKSYCHKKRNKCNVCIWTSSSFKNFGSHFVFHI